MAENTSESLPRIKEVRAFVKKATGGDQGKPNSFAYKFSAYSDRCLDIEMALAEVGPPSLRYHASTSRRCRLSRCGRPALDQWPPNSHR